MAKRQNMKKYVTHQDVICFFTLNLLGLVFGAISYGIGRYLFTCSACQLVESTPFVCGVGIMISWLIAAILGTGAVVLVVYGWAIILGKDE